MNPAANLILVGPMGAGKTSIGRRLAERLGLDFVDADVALETITGATVNLIFELEGEAGFRERERQLLAELCGQAGKLIATGGGAVLDAGTRRLLAASGFVIYLRTGVERQLERLAKDRTRPLLQAPDRQARLTAMAALRGPLYEEVADLVYDSDQANVGTACDALLAELATRWQRAPSAARHACAGEDAGDGAGEGAVGCGISRTQPGGARAGERAIERAVDGTTKRAAEPAGERTDQSANDRAGHPASDETAHRASDEAGPRVNDGDGHRANEEAGHRGSDRAGHRAGDTGGDRVDAAAGGLPRDHAA